MTLWSARIQADTYLEEECPEKLAVLIEMFDVIDSLVDCYEKHSDADAYARVCGLSLLKAKNLALGALSLILDGLGQEAGALLRPFIEYTELLTYFRHFPEQVNNVADDKLPSAGARAKAINGIYKNFREHLNLHASHSSYSHYALSHLLEPESLNFKKYQRFVPNVLDKNLKDISVQIFLLLYEATLSIEKLNLPEFNKLAERVDTLKEKLFREFRLDEP